MSNEIGAIAIESYGRSSGFRRKPSNTNSRFDVNSFCSLIHNAIPTAVKDGRFVVVDDTDQSGFSDTQVPMSVAPPKGFIPKLQPRFRTPKLNVPKIKVPELRANHEYSAPRIRRPMSFSSLRSSSEDVTSAERMEAFKKGVQKMLHVVKVLGQIDQYLSERTRIIIDKLAKTFAD
ncbi:Arp2/3 complex p21 subunit [Operophtera brumata]|uniref:Arp2/3 complex p21 subunit n=1 Tax=Operophtera brumata TaxID=104452 RepID=A0A0L7LJL6_OPEBR|nr:Arp2/3 complex p21 subunit [Operophtera brumata]